MDKGERINRGTHARTNIMAATSGQEMAAKLVEAQARQQKHREIADRRLAELDAEEQAERKDKEMARKRATSFAPPSAEKTGAVVAEAPKYWHLAGTLGSFCQAMQLHPSAPVAATGGALGSVSVWSQHLSPTTLTAGAVHAAQQTAAYTAAHKASDEHSMPKATGEERWQLVDTLSTSRSSDKEMVLALAFIPTPSASILGDTYTTHATHAGTHSNGVTEVYLACASSDRSITIWCGPASAHAAHASGNGHTPLSESHGSSQHPKRATHTHTLVQTYPSSGSRKEQRDRERESAIQTGRELNVRVEKQPRVRLMLQVCVAVC